MRVALIGVALIVATYNFTTTFNMPQRIENCWTPQTPCMRDRT